TALNSQPGSSVPINPKSNFNSTQIIGRGVFPNPDTVGYSFKYPASDLTPQIMSGDPYTPLLRAYENDRIQVRTLVGAHLLPHFFNIHGVKWLFEPSAKNSGWRSTQVMSLSEHFEMNFSLPTTQGALSPDGSNRITDYLYTASADQLGLEHGLWGIMRAYKSHTDGLAALPDNRPGNPNIAPEPCGCPKGAPVKQFEVTALSAISRFGDIFPANPNFPSSLIYNDNYKNSDNTAMVYIPDNEVDLFKNDTSYIVEPLVLRANAGDCIKVKVSNGIPLNANIQATGVKYGQATDEVGYAASFTVGLHAELLSYDASTDDGTNVGLNDVQTITPPATRSVTDLDSRTYTWYAGRYEYNEGNNTWKAVDTEFGSVPLLPADPILQSFSGLFGSLIIEPKVSFWKTADQHKDAINVFADRRFSRLLFREHVFQFQDNLAVKSIKNTGNPDGAAVVINAINYRSEPLGNRYLDNDGWNAQNPDFNSLDISNILTNSIAGSVPVTPMPVAKKGTPVRFRILHPGGSGNGEVFTLHGHNWQEEPYTDNSDKLGHNRASQWLGSRGQIGVWNTFDILLKSAGGANGVTGDYLYRSFPNGDFKQGVWGLFVVTDGRDAVMAVGADTIKGQSSNYKVSGFVSIDPESNTQAKTVSVLAAGNTVSVPVANNGTWEFTGLVDRKGVIVTSANKGVLRLSLTRINALVGKEDAPPPAASIPHADLRKISSQKRVLTEIGLKKRTQKR
ncbi:MAG: hypothetical protein ACI81W_003401, partial [Saprospiraceae bacterium]